MIVVHNRKVENSGIEMGLRNEQNPGFAYLQAAEEEHTVAVGPGK